MDVYRVAELLRDNWGYLALLLPLLVGGLGLLLQGRLRGEAHRVVAAVYRTAIHAASELQEEGIEWVRSPDGIAFRKGLAERAYDALPARIGVVPVGVVKVFVSRERFAELVESAF